MLSTISLPAGAQAVTFSCQILASPGTSEVTEMVESGFAVRNECLRSLKKTLARVSAKARFNIKRKHDKVLWQNSFCCLQGS